MTFEEKYAAQGRKLDELKAKLDAAVDARKLAREKTREEIAADIDALDAKIDEFNASVDAKIDAKAEEIDAKMDAKAEEIDAKIDAKAEEVSAKAEEVGVKVEQGAAKAKSALTLDKATAEAVANEPTRLAELEKRTAGNFAAAEENARLIRARRDAKCSNAKLRTEMKVNAAKEKVAERKEARDKAAQEDWIIDLLAYANSCYEMAYAWAMEAEYTMMEAAYEIDYYNEKFIDKK
jgi:autotransporter translocation and assembly factor TamB